MEDKDIVALYWARSEEAVRATAAKYGAYCAAIIRRFLGDGRDSEECLNDTWLGAWNAMPPQRPGILSAFFGKLTRNLSLDRWRYNRAAKRGGPQVETALEELGECLPAPGRPEDRLEERETADLISRFLREQPQLDRVLFLRRYWYLDSVAALAERFSMNENTVKSRLHRTRLRLKEVLLREGVAV